MLFDELLNSPYLMGSEPTTGLQTYWIEPEFGHFLFPFDMNMGWLGTVTGVKEKPIWSYLFDSGHYPLPSGRRRIRF